MNDELYKITIRKPIHGTYCSIDIRKLREAVQNHQMIEVTILGVGSAVVDPKWWYETGKKEKRVVNYANNPMTFIYNYAPIQGKLKAQKDVSVNQLSLI